MLDYTNSTIIFYWVLSVYFLPMIVGFIIGTMKSISLTKMSEISTKFGDPLTIKIHKWSRKFKITSIKNGQWILLFFLIFLNNLILAAFVTRILYGVIFIIPLFLTAWEGFGHGVIFSKPKARGGIILTFFEFGGYLFATVVGVKIGVNVLISIINGTELIINIPWFYIFLMTVFLFIGAVIETISMKFVSKKIDLTNIDKIDLDKRRTEMAKHFDEDEE